MARFAVKTLEFDKVKNMLASKAATFLGKQVIISLQIESEFSKVKRLQEETAEALRILDEGRRFPFGGAFNPGSLAPAAPAVPATPPANPSPFGGAFNPGALQPKPD